MQRFTLKTFTELDPAYVTDADHDLGTAHVWVLHLRVDDAERVWLLLRATGSEVLTGDAVGGDSWREWCEPVDTEPEALHVYFHAATQEDAMRTAQALCVMIGQTDPTSVAVSTAGDWAEQTPDIWPAL